MATYEFARVAWNNIDNTGTVVCTNTNELEDLVVDVLEEESLLYLPTKKDGDKKLFINRHRHNGPFMIELSRVDHRDLLRWWLVNWFCERGWEPFSQSDNSYSFRRVREQN